MDNKRFRSPQVQETLYNNTYLTLATPHQQAHCSAIMQSNRSMSRSSSPLPGGHELTTEYDGRMGHDERRTHTRCLCLVPNIKTEFIAEQRSRVAPIMLHLGVGQHALGMRW
jgi:hypothetical protein